MNADEKRKVFEELLEEYQNHIESEFSYDEGERETERKVWLNKYDGIKEPLIKDEKIRKVVRAWAEANGYFTARYSSVNNCFCHQGNMLFVEPSYELEQLDSLGYRTIAELCGEEEE